MVSIAWPINTAPGLNAQDGAGQLINVYAEPRQNGQGMVWRRSPGATVFTTIYMSTASMTGTGTATFLSMNQQGDLAVSVSGTVSFIGVAA